MLHSDSPARLCYTLAFSFMHPVLLLGASLGGITCKTYNHDNVTTVPRFSLLTKCPFVQKVQKVLCTSSKFTSANDYEK